MTMVPATKISKQPHLYFYGGCGVASDVMTRFAADGCTPPASGYGGYTNNINQNTITTTNDDVIIVANINGNATNTATNGVLLGSDLGIGHPNSSSYTSHYNNNNNNNLILMADEEQHSRTSNSTSVNDDGDNQPGSIKERDDTSTPPTSDHQRGSSSNSWLQLGLGTTSTTFEQHHQRPTEVLTTPFEQHQQRTTAHQMGGGGSGGGGLMLELNLGGGGSTGIIPQQRLDFTSSSGLFAAEASVVGSANFLLPPPPPPHHHHPIFPLIPPPPPQSQLSSYYPPPFLISDHYFQQQQQQQIGIGWGFVNPQRTVVAAGCSSSLSPSSSSSMPPSQGSFLTRPSADALDSEFRIIHPPPRRPHSGIWFALQASPHQSKEPFLPQVSKSFLRIKDGRMTVRLVMKYVANKLGLDSESEVEIRCRGQEVVPYLTLQHVRDNIWSPRDAAVTLHPDSSTTDHLMILHYGRSSTSPI